MLLLQLLVIFGAVFTPPFLKWAYFTFICSCCLYFIVYKRFLFLVLTLISFLSAMWSLSIPSRPDVGISLPAANYQWHLSRTAQPVGADHYTLVLITQDQKLSLQWQQLVGSHAGGELLLSLHSDVPISYQVPIKLVNQAPEGKEGVTFEAHWSGYRFANRMGDYFERRLFLQSHVFALQLTQLHSAQLFLIQELTSAWHTRLVFYLDEVFNQYSSWRFTRALVFGRNNQFQQSDIWLIRVLGLSHLFVVSGLHVGFIYVFCKVLVFGLWYGITWLPIRGVVTRSSLELGLCLPVALLYASVVGWGPAVTRATLMLFLWLLMRAIARKITAISVLFLALYGILLFDARSLLLPGLWLSFVLVWLLMQFYQQHSMHALRWPMMQLMLTLSATIMVVDWQEQLSLWSLVVNMVMVPFTGFIWFPLSVLSVFEALILGSTWLAYSIDGVMLSVIAGLKWLVFTGEFVSLASNLPLLIKIWGVALVWIAVKTQNLRCFLIVMLLAGLFVWSGEARMTKVAAMCWMSCPQAQIMVKQDADSLWVNENSGPWYSLRWHQPLENASKPLWVIGGQENVKLFVHTASPNTLNANDILANEANWYVFKRPPSQDTIALLSALQVQWLVVEPKEWLIIRHLSHAWYVSYSGCSFFSIISQDLNCQRIELLENMVN